MNAMSERREGRKEGRKEEEDDLREEEEEGRTRTKLDAGAAAWREEPWPKDLGRL